MGEMATLAKMVVQHQFPLSNRNNTMQGSIQV